MWKAGQIVTINGKRYRVKRSLRLSPCPECDFFGNSNVCSNICFPDKRPNTKLEDDYYLELIRGKAEKVLPSKQQSMLNHGS